MRRTLTTLAALTALGLAMGVVATTWGPKSMNCPLCGKESTFEVIASHGSYIYGWPSRFQLIFWPDTTDRVVYFCRHCHLSMFMGDFQKLPKEKFEAVKKAIAPLKKAQEDKSYYEIPMPYRLKIAEAVYKQLDKDYAFWCHFYRVLGYHLSKAGKSEEATAARLKALALAEKMLESDLPEPPKKELVLVVGSMQHFTGQKEKAIKTLDQVAKTPIVPSKSISEEHAKNATAYLDELAEEFLALIREGKDIPG